MLNSFFVIYSFVLAVGFGIDMLSVYVFVIASVICWQIYYQRKGHKFIYSIKMTIISF